MDCPDCEEKQWSVADKKYVQLCNTCWSCDRKRWQEGELDKLEFELREEEAAKV